jgi:hypothetical protein
MVIGFSGCYANVKERLRPAFILIYSQIKFSGNFASEKSFHSFAAPIE